VDRSTGTPTCIDDTLAGISWGKSSAQNTPVQFDDAGVLYYFGWSTDGHTVLRRYDNGVTKDLINDAIYVGDFLVTGDGSVFVSGTTTSTTARWVRRITPGGGLQTLVASGNANFLRAFPDGNVYMGLSEGSNPGVRRFLMASGLMDPTYWLVRSFSSGVLLPTYFDVAAICGQSLDPTATFCGSSGSYVQGIFETLDSKVYVLAGFEADGRLMQYYPMVAVADTVIKKGTVALGLGAGIVLAGLDDLNHNVMTLFNTSSNSEQSIITATSEIEVYHLTYAASTGKIMFDGLRFSDNTYLVGVVDPSTLGMTVTATGSGRLVDFEAFR
jgi:hypothetical protein